MNGITVTLPLEKYNELLEIAKKYENIDSTLIYNQEHLEVAAAHAILRCNDDNQLLYRAVKRNATSVGVKMFGCSIDIRDLSTYGIDISFLEP